MKLQFGLSGGLFGRETGDASGKSPGFTHHHQIHQRLVHELANRTQGPGTGEHTHLEASKIACVHDIHLERSIVSHQVPHLL